MRINIYSQEILPEVVPVTQIADTGIMYAAVRFMLHSSERLHNTASDDDRSAVTFWLPASIARRELIASMFDEAAKLIRDLPLEDQIMLDGGG